MIEPTKENIISVREEYRRGYEAGLLRTLREAEELIFESEAGPDGHTKGEILEFEERMKNLTLPPESYEFIEKALDPKNRSGHNSVLKSGLDLREYLDDMSELDHEKFRLIVLDFDCNYVGTVEADENGATYVGVEKKHYKQLIELCENVLLPKVVTAHNHPYSIAAIPSDQDGKLAMSNMMMLKRLRVDLYDDVIISPMDFYSRRQDEKKREEEGDLRNRIVLKPIMTDELAKLMHKENQFLFGAITGHMRLNPEKPGV